MYVLSYALCVLFYFLLAALEAMKHICVRPHVTLEGTHIITMVIYLCGKNVILTSTIVRIMLINPYRMS